MERGRKKSERSIRDNSKQNTIPSMIRKTQNENGQKNSGKKTLISVSTTPNSTFLNNTLSSDESDSPQNNRSKNCKRNEKNGKHVDSECELIHSTVEDALDQPNVDVIEASSSNNSEENVLLFDKYFHILPETEDEKKNLTALCVACSKDTVDPVKFRGSRNATSNFVRHLKVIFSVEI